MKKWIIGHVYVALVLMKKIVLYKAIMSDVPRSEVFDDVYFSPADGLAETRYVFLDGNNLPDAWAGKDEFTICETGFGTGLNFLAVLHALVNDQNKPKKLHYTSFEKYPLSREDIQKYLTRWGELDLLLDVFLTNYPSDINKEIYYIDVSDDISLTLIFGDVNDKLPKLNAEIDCWFLDGFKPSSNPDMWSETVFENVARLSRDGASFSTFTSASTVRSGLSAVGFDVRKIPGYRYKREMSVGTYSAFKAA